MNTEMPLKPSEAERLIECLRSGVPFPSLAEQLPIGRGHLLTKVREHLNESNPRPIVIRANYGDGKTHFIQSVAGMALAAGFVVSTVAISREAPLYKLEQLYGRVVDGTRVPESAIPGIQSILERLREQPSQVREALLESKIPDRLAAAVEAYLQDDITFRDELLSDLSGQFLLASRLQFIMRQLLGTRRLQKFIPSKQPMEFYRCLSRLIQLAGYAGWVILLDEVELIGKTGLGMRARAYANFERLTQSHELGKTLVVAAVASNFYSDIMEEKQDRARAPEWLRNRKLEDLANLADGAIHTLSQAERLPPLSPRETEELLAAVRTAHEKAYSWEAPQLSELIAAIHKFVPETDAKIRTKVRTAIWWLDLWWQYGKEPSVTVWHVGETDLTEDPERTQDFEEKVSVQRDRIF